MDLNAIFTALAQSDKEAQERSPFNPISDVGNQIGDLIVKQSPKHGYGENILAGLLSGFTGGYADRLTDQYRAKQNDLALDTLEGALTGRSILNRPDGMSPSVFNNVKNAGTIFKAQRALDIGDDLRKSNLSDRGTVLAALAQAQTPQQQQRIISAAKSMGVIDNDFSMEGGVTDARPMVESTELEPGPDLGVPSLNQKVKTLYQQNLDAGMPPIQAATSARDSIKDLRDRSKSLYGDQIKDEAQKIGNLEELIRLGEEGISKAGATGGIAPGLASGYEKVMSWLGSDEAKGQSAGDSMLDQTQQLGAAANRIVGSGALSDFETKALFNTAMSSAKPRSQNEAILKSYKNGLAILKEHQNFLNYYLDKTGGDTAAAQNFWELYKKENPILKKNTKGEYVINDKRTPWQKFDFKSANQKFLSGDTPLYTGETPPSLDVPTSTKSIGGKTYQKVNGGWQLVK